MKILLVRHGETEWNRVNRLQGQLDSPVTEHGCAQIAALIGALADEKIERIVSSPSGRAVAAARQLAGHFSCPMRFDARLNERGFGVLEGKVYSQLTPDEQRLFERIYSAESQVTPQYGESLAAAASRTLEALLAIGATAERCVCVVSHGHVLQAVISCLKHATPEHFPRYGHPNGSYSILDYTEGKLSVVKWGIATHLVKRR